MLDLEAIKANADKYAKAIGPGGEKAWLAGQLATDVRVLVAEVELLRALLAEFVDDEPCEFDHHGGCQVHGFLEPGPGQRCHVARARELLGGAS